MFEHLKSLEVVGKTAWIDLPEMGDGARIQVRYAGPTNPAYLNEGLRLAVDRPIIRDPAASIRQDRADDAAIFPKCIIVAWEKFRGADGKEIPFSQQHADEFCQKVPAYLFDRVRMGAKNAQRFLPVEALVGN